MESLWKLGGLTWTELGKRVWREMAKDDVWGRSAQLSYYFLLALFPLLLFLISMLGFLASAGSELRQGLMNYLSSSLPGAAGQMVQQNLDQALHQRGGGKLSFGILAALWAASNGMTAIMDTLNIAYDQEETRPWWKKRAVAIGLTIALGVLIISALVLVLYGGRIAELVGSQVGLGKPLILAWKIVQWPVVLAFMLISFSLVYYFAPDVRDQKWYWVTPGAAVGLTLWILITIGFRIYLSFSNTYGATYGSLGAVIILMLWFYFTGASILIGGEINSEIEHVAAERGKPEAKLKGEKEPGPERKAA